MLYQLNYCRVEATQGHPVLAECPESPAGGHGIQMETVARA